MKDKIQTTLLFPGLLAVIITGMTVGAIVAGIAGLTVGFVAFFYSNFSLFSEIKMLLTFECHKHQEKLQWGLTSLKGNFRETSFYDLKKTQFPWSGIRENSEKGAFRMKAKFCKQCSEEEVKYLDQRESEIEKNGEWLILNLFESNIKKDYSAKAIKIQDSIPYTFECAFSQFAHFLFIKRGDKHETEFGLMINEEDDPKAISEAVLKVTSSNIKENLDTLNKLDLDSDSGLIDIQKILDLQNSK